MTTNTEKVLIWLKDFKHIWLLQQIPNDRQLIQLISNKIEEVERLLTQEHENNNQNIQTDNRESCIPSDEQQQSSSIPLNYSQSIEKETPIMEKLPSRPVIRLKRIPLNEVEQYLPVAYQPPKSKRGRKPKNKNSLIISPHSKKAKKNTSIIQPPSTEVEIEIQSNDVRRSIRSKKFIQTSPSLPSISSSNGKKKPRERKKLRAIDAEDDDLLILGHAENSNAQNDCEHISRYLGQNGILSQTRKTNETIQYAEDFTFQLHSRQSKNKSSNDTSNIELISSAPQGDHINLVEDENMLENILENHDNESLFATLDMVNEKPLEPLPKCDEHSIMNYTDCIEDISEDEFDPPL